VSHAHAPGGAIPLEPTPDRLSDPGPRRDGPLVMSARTQGDPRSEPPTVPEGWIEDAIEVLAELREALPSEIVRAGARGDLAIAAAHAARLQRVSVLLERAGRDEATPTGEVCGP